MSKSIKKIAVIFPGIGYNPDRPLLYWGRKLAVQDFGYEAVNVPYGHFDKKTNIRGNEAAMQEAFDTAMSQAEEILWDVDFAQYDRILFISKSVGTAVAAAYAARHGLATDNLYYTPIEQTFQVIRPESGIAFHGTKDQWTEGVPIEKLCEENRIPVHLIPDSNHSLETGDTMADLKNLVHIMEISRQYLAGTQERNDIQDIR